MNVGVRSRIWLILGVVVGLAVSAGKLPFVAGAARSLADSAQSIIGSAGHKLINAVAKRGGPRRAVEAVQSVLAILVPGATALLLIVAARATIVLRRIVAVLLVVVGFAAYAYQPGGVATGAVVLAIAVAAAAVMVTGPLVLAPLAALAGLIGGEFLPRLLERHSTLPNAPVAALHQALFNSTGNPVALRIVVLVLAVVPFALAARLVVLD